MVDILLTEEQNLVIKNNDLVIGESDDQNVYDILISEKGEYKRTPQIGVGANNLLNSPFDEQSVKALVRLNLEIDNFKVDDIIIEDNDEGFVVRPVCKRK